MGKNTPERQDFIIANLKIEKDLIEVRGVTNARSEWRNLIFRFLPSVHTNAASNPKTMGGRSAPGWRQIVPIASFGGHPLSNLAVRFRNGFK